MEAKHFIFLAMTATFIPVASWFGINYRWAERLLVAGCFFSTSYLIDINFVSMEQYRGDTRGFEFGITDWMVIALIIVMAKSPRWQHRKLDLIPPNGNIIMVYLLMALISASVAYVGVYAGFGLFKLIRAIAVYWVAYNYLREEEDLHFILMILAGIVAMEFLIVLKQRLGGIYRAPGTTPHSNTLAVYINMMNMIFFAFILGEKSKRTIIYWACLGMGSVMVLATFSRGALVSMIMGYTLVIVLSFYDKPTPHKSRVILTLFLLALPVAIKVAPAIIDRFLNAPEASGESRHYANDAAKAMANDHPFGVGINNYSYVINETKYVAFIDNPVDRGIVHNVYLLHACEMGWGGLAVFLLMIGNFFLIGLREIRKRRNNTITTMAVGIVVAMFTLWFQSMLEWLFRQTYVTVQFFMLAGFLAALTRVDKQMIKHKRTERMKMAWLMWMMDKRRRSKTKTLPAPAPANARL
ncbi:MAG: O-antigen ligase family protein [Gammaproteobacteria bacterium]|nr:O-antigen ligase family protein [Gammaproteobacteria bacterium]MCP5136664.1 O-antigen ligase family protein [Gammaproteobacteria bacterium]